MTDTMVYYIYCVVKSLPVIGEIVGHVLCTKILNVMGDYSILEI